MKARLSKAEKNNYISLAFSYFEKADKSSWFKKAKYDLWFYWIVIQIKLLW